MNNILLDLDGTIADSAPGILASYSATLRELGHTPDPSIDLNFVIGPALPDVMPLVLRPYGDDRVDLAVTTYRRIYSEIGVLDAQPYDGIPALLNALHAGARCWSISAWRICSPGSMAPNPAARWTTSPN
jgi:phosphoglycolate phosphatase